MLPTNRRFLQTELFSLASQRPRKVHTSLEDGLHSHSAVLYDGKLLISGGLDEDGNIPQHFYTYDWNAG